MKYHLDYPGFEAFQEQLEKTYAAWVNMGCPSDGKKYILGKSSVAEIAEEQYCLPPCITHGNTIFASYDNFPTGFFGGASDEELSRIRRYAQSCGLSCQIKDYRHGNVYITLIAPSVQALKDSGLSTWYHNCKKQIQDAIPLAQKFYESPLMAQINQLPKNTYKYSFWWQGTFGYDGCSSRTVYGSEGYTSSVGTSWRFQELGYRNLKDRQELIAFILAAYCYNGWKVAPNQLQLPYLVWNVEFREVDGFVVEHTYPYYNPPKPKEVPPPLKDFF